MSARAEITVNLSIVPPTGQTTEDGSQAYSAAKSGIYAYHDRVPFNLSGPEQVIALGPITSGKMLYAKADSAVTLKLTTADGADQLIPIEGVFAWQCSSKPFTALKIVGTGQGVLAFAGD